MKNNIIKGDLYTFAWDRIEKGMKEGFYLEVITICESMISDRLISYALGVGKIENKSIETMTIGGLLRAWKNREDEKIKVDCNSGGEEFQTDDLLGEIDKFWASRNQMLHGIAKSTPGESPKLSAKEFWGKAKSTAETGRRLARLVLRWHEKEASISKRQEDKS